MPVMDGYKATSMIRARSGLNQDTPIVALTANAFAEDRERCLASGMNDHVTKPIQLKNLRAVIAKWAGKRVSSIVEQFGSSETGAPVNIASENRGNATE